MAKSSSSSHLWEHRSSYSWAKGGYNATGHQGTASHVCGLCAVPGQPLLRRRPRRPLRLFT